MFARETYVIVGDEDFDPNSAGLRDTPEADTQGQQRVPRAQHYYQEEILLLQKHTP